MKCSNSYKTNAAWFDTLHASSYLEIHYRNFSSLLAFANLGIRPNACIITYIGMYLIFSEPLKLHKFKKNPKDIQSWKEKIYICSFTFRIYKLWLLSINCFKCCSNRLTYFIWNYNYWKSKYKIMSEFNGWNNSSTEFLRKSDRSIQSVK